MISATFRNELLCEGAVAADCFQADFIGGLKRRPKILSSKYFYDEQGSRLFDQICELDEYYLTRAETAILQDNIGEIVQLCGPACALIELGSGSSRKTRLLLDALARPAAYIPIDISKTHLFAAAQALSADYASLEILPVWADFAGPFTLPLPKNAPQRKVVFFPVRPSEISSPRKRSSFFGISALGASWATGF